MPHLSINVQVPADYAPRIDELLQKCYAKHNGHLTFSVELPHKPRTTGPHSQSAHLHGHLQQLGKELGYSLNEIKAVMKEDCIDWPRHQVVFHGRTYMVPDSEADATTLTESAAIEWCHVRAAELGIRLIEEEA